MKRLFAVALSMLASAAYCGTIYVAESGSDETGTGASDSPYKTLKVAVEAAHAAIADAGETEMTVSVAPGTYEVLIADGPLMLTAPIKVIGTGEKPDDVKVKSSHGGDTFNGTNRNGSIFVLEHKDSVVANLLVVDGYVATYATSLTNAGGFTIKHGKVKGCIIQNCRSGGLNSRVGGVYLQGDDAILSQCIVKGCYLKSSGVKSYSPDRAGGVYLTKGRIENCLIKDCYLDDSNKEYNARHIGGLRVEGGSVVNCTIVNNRGYNAGGLRVTGGSLTNCVIGGNTITTANTAPGVNDHAFLGKADYFNTCALDTEASINGTCVALPAADMFADYEAGDFSPRFGSPLVDGGLNSAVTEEMTTDLVGKTRIKGQYVDIGAYEADSRIEITVEVASSEFGTVTIPEGPYYAGDELSLKAVPNEGCKFLCWEGDLPDELLETAEVTFAPSGNISLLPRFAPADSDSVMYVSPTGADTNDGFAADRAKRSVGAAVVTLEGSYGFGEIRVAPGDYAISKPIVVTRAVKIVGQGESVETVVVRNTVGRNGSNRDNRVFAFDHADSALYGVTVQGGYICDWGGAPSAHGFLAGANISVYAGVVSNCVIQSGRGDGYRARSAGAYVGGPDALLTHSVIRNNNYSEAEVTAQGIGSYNAAGGVRLGGGRVENCLIYGNTINDTLFEGSASAVWADKGTIANCTIYNNSGHLNGAVRLSGSAKAYNLALIGNTLGDGEDKVTAPWCGTAAGFVNCAGDVETPINETCKTLTAADFRNYAEGDMRPATMKGLYNAGAEVSLASETDFSGAPRLFGTRIDIGALEAQTAGLSVSVR